MKNLPSDSGIRRILRDGDFKGSNRSHGRVTVEPYWKLNLTEEGYGDGNRGPYRWYQRADDSQFEVEVPNIKSIEITRDIDQPVASCTIVIYNQWHNLNDELPELASQLGKPGYFWFERGKTGTDPDSRWNHTESTGGKTRSGAAATDDGQPFSWVNVLVPNAMIRTYQGYGGHGSSIDAALASHNLTRTGVWIVDTVVAGTDGLLTLSCRDVGRLLMNQRIFPPLVPEYLYPLDYYPDGKSAFDSPWEPPILGDGTEAAARGVNPTVFAGSSMGVRDNGDPMNLTPGNVGSQWPQYAKDNLPNTWSWTQATDRPDDNTNWWDFRTTSAGTANTSEITVYPWGGGYVMYVSIDEGAGWVDYADSAVGPLSYHVRPDGTTDSIGGYPYVAIYPIPDAEPGKERPLTFDLPRTFDIEKIRITFRHAKLTSSGYRSGLRDLVCVKVAEPLTLDSITTGAEDIICVGISRSGGSGGVEPNGYWVLDSSGHTYGFGDAADYDETIFGAATSHCVTQFFGINDYNHYAAMVGHPDGQGYWLLEQNGYVSAFGSAAFMGHNVRWPPGPRLQYFNSLIGDIAMDIAVNSDGTGYWVVYADGQVWGFGAEGGSGTLVYNVPITDTAVFATAIMNARTPKFQLYYGTAMVGHPTAAPGTQSFWVSNGWGEVFNHGECKSYGGFVNAKSSGNPYGVALDPDEWIWAMDCTGDGGGYWLVGGSGRIAQFGNAIGRGETDLYKDFRNQQFPSDPYAEFDPKLLRDVYKGMIRDIIRGHDKPDPDNGGVGGGYYAVTGGGHVIAIRENEWGEPSYWGRSGFRWHQGNYKDYADIVKELLLWSGFLLYDGTTLDVHGDLEFTGIKSDTHITLDLIDKKTVLEVINMLREIVGYTFFIDDEGAAHLESANFWSSGNFITNGSTRTHTVDYPDPIDERTNLISYSAMADGSQLVSEIITGNDVPRFQIPQEVHFLRLESSNAVAPIKTSTEHGTATPLRGIENPMMYTNAMFKNPDEQRIMAELIALRIWFSQRTGSVRMVCDPTVQINDQIKIIERNTSESYYHYVRSISTSMDLDTGEYTAQLSTNWLGSADTWTITRDNLTDALRQVKISEKGDHWQVLAAGENNRPSLETGFIGTGSAESRLDWRFNQDYITMNRALSGSVLVNNTTWSATGNLNIESLRGGGGVTDAVVTVELYQPDILGPFTVTIDTTPYSITKNGQQFHTGALSAGNHTITVAAASPGVPKEGNVVLGLKIEASGAGSSFASMNIVIHNETALPNPGEEPVGPKCLGIGLTTFWDGTDVGHLITDPYLTWTVTFSEPVIGLTSGDFSVRSTGSITHGELGITGSGDTYTVLVVGITGTGKIGVDLQGASTIVGWPSGNPMPALTTTGKPYYRTG